MVVRGSGLEAAAWARFSEMALSPGFDGSPLSAYASPPCGGAAQTASVLSRVLFSCCRAGPAKVVVWPVKKVVSCASWAGGGCGEEEEEVRPAATSLGCRCW